MTDEDWPPVATPRLAAALAELQSQLPRVKATETAKVQTKDGGPGYSYRYADLAGINAAIMPLLGKLGMAFMARPTLTADNRFVLAYELMHSSGESRTGEYPLPTQGTPQAIGSAITYARRYTLCAVTGLAAETDDDGHAAGAEHKDPSRARRARAEPQPQPQPETGREPTDTALRGMFAAFNDAGMRDKEAQLDFIHAAIGRRIESRSELTAREVAQLTRQLREGHHEDKTEAPI